MRYEGPMPKAPKLSLEERRAVKDLEFCLRSSILFRGYADAMRREGNRDGADGLDRVVDEYIDEAITEVHAGQN